MFKRNLAILVAAILAAGFAPKDEPNPEPPPDKTDTTKLQGIWELQSSQLLGKGKLGKKAARRRMKVTVKKTSWEQVRILSSGTEATPVKYTIEVNNTKKPAWLDLKRVGYQSGMKGIYQIEGDTLKFCYTGSINGTRPTGFDDTNGRYFLLTFKKVKK